MGKKGWEVGVLVNMHTGHLKRQWNANKLKKTKEGLIDKHQVKPIRAGLTTSGGKGTKTRTVE